jgi:hypothetical protein
MSLTSLNGFLFAAAFATGVCSAGTAGAQNAATPSNITMKGDFRYRHEQIFQEGSRQLDRERIRARLNMTAAVQKNVAVVIAFASGATNDPVSANQDLMGGFSDKPLWIDMAYFDWTTPLSGLKIQGGKMKNPFFAPGRTQMIWDVDLNPEGFDAQYSKKSGAAELFANGSVFWVEERPTADDSFLLGGQAGVRNATGALDMTGGVGVYVTTNAKGRPTFYDPAKSYGNSVDASKKYLHDYRLAEAFGELGLASAIPVRLSADYVNNFAPGVTDNQAWTVGIGIGKTAAAGSMSGQVSWRRVERDALIGAFCESDFAGGGTDSKGAVFQYEYMLSKAVALDAVFFLNTKGLAKGTDYHRLELDSTFRF